MSRKYQLEDDELEELFTAEKDAWKGIAKAQKRREKEGCYICGKPIMKGQQTCNEHLVAGFLDKLDDSMMGIEQTLSSGFLDMENAIDELRKTIEEKWVKANEQAK